MLKLSNYNKPSNPKWRKIGDIAIVAIPIYTSIILTLPGLDPNTVTWVNAIGNSILATIKLIGQFTLDPNYTEENKI
jgi:hypothetical protein